jgi:protein tyrosine phosphatase (PTP) superfamily phosphohydrolase (DUF442 family)
MDNKYMAGAQPTERGYRWLKSKGVTTVINLRVPDEHERAMLEGMGLKYVHVAWADTNPPSLEQVKDMLKSVNESGGKTFQHCLRGIGRDMTMAACYMVANHGEAADKVIKEGAEAAPRWEADQKKDPKTGEPAQFKLVHDFERAWKAESPVLPKN